MKKYWIAAVGVLLVLTVAWAAFGQAAGGAAGAGGRRGQGGGAGGAGGAAGGGRGMGGFGRMTETQTKAIAALVEQAGKLKALMEAPMPGMAAGMPGMAAGTDFQNMSDEDRTKMREAMTQRREQQTQIIAAIVQEVDRLKGRQLQTEQDEAMAPLKEILASAQKEKATETAGRVEALIKARESAYDAKLKALGIDPATLMRGGMGGMGGMGGRGGAGGGGAGGGGRRGGAGGGGGQ